VRGISTGKGAGAESSPLRPMPSGCARGRDRRGVPCVVECVPVRQGTALAGGPDTATTVVIDISTHGAAAAAPSSRSRRRPGLHGLVRPNAPRSPGTCATGDDDGWVAPLLSLPSSLSRVRGAGNGNGSKVPLSQNLSSSSVYLPSHCQGCLDVQAA
ncbi:hypothetical protein EDB83DRAFT_2421026, partial [Lactarius deliciosus]